jgi:hypothetical protein
MDNGDYPEEENDSQHNNNLLGYHNYHQMKEHFTKQQQQPHTINHKPNPNFGLYQNFAQNNHISKIPIHSQRPPHKYSPQYAAYVGAKPRAQASARVGMGGVY